jgi:hypothetical protein
MTQVTRELIELAERVEKAEGADRGLDADIRLAVSGDCPYGALTGNRHQVIGWGKLSGYVNAYREVLTLDDALDDEVVPRFTASIDAAMSLGPEGCVWKVMTDYELPGRATVYGWPVGAPEGPPILIGYDDHCDAATPALALCAAALRARSAATL